MLLVRMLVGYPYFREVSLNYWHQHLGSSDLRAEVWKKRQLEPEHTLWAHDGARAIPSARPLERAWNALGQRPRRVSSREELAARRPDINEERDERTQIRARLRRPQREQPAVPARHVSEGR
jgi:hypothetical protein